MQHVQLHSGVITGLTILSIMLLAAFFAPLPYDPFKPDGYSVLKAPGTEHWFGPNEKLHYQGSGESTRNS